MKILAFILSLYILALNLTPCEDSVEVDVIDSKIEMTQNGDINESHSDLDLCSPFCQCQCCHIHTTTSSPSDFVLVLNKISTEIILHFDSLGKDIHISIFQPPKYT